MSEQPDGASETNRDVPRPVREPVFNLAPAVVGFIAVCVGVHLIRSFLLDQSQDVDLLVRTAFIPDRYSGEYLLDLYAFTSPVTYSLLHGSWMHLAVNMIWLAAFGSPLANRIGAWRFVLFWCFASVAAVGLHFVLHASDAVPLIGASGAISGMMGAAARFGFQVDRRQARPAFRGGLLSIGEALSSRGVVTFLAIWFVVNLVSGLGYLTPGGDQMIAWEAHIGGFLAGFFGIRLFDQKQVYRDL